MAKIIYLIFILFVTLFQPINLFAQEYVVGGDFDYAPYTFIDKTGKPSGLEIEVLEAIAASSGIELNIQLSSWESALSKMKSGKTDIIAGIINSSAKNTLILLDNLLTWAKSQTGKNMYAPEKTSLHEIISEILEVSKSIAKIKTYL